MNNTIHLCTTYGSYSEMVQCATYNSFTMPGAEKHAWKRVSGGQPKLNLFVLNQKRVPIWS